MCKRKEKNEKERMRRKQYGNHLLVQFRHIASWEQGPQSARGSSQEDAAFMRASLTEAIWDGYGRFTIFSEGPARATWKLLNWEMSESGRKRERCFVSEVRALTQSTLAEQQQYQALHTVACVFTLSQDLWALQRQGTSQYQQVFTVGNLSRGPPRI